MLLTWALGGFENCPERTQQFHQKVTAAQQQFELRVTVMGPLNSLQYCVRSALNTILTLSVYYFPTLQQQRNV